MVIEKHLISAAPLEHLPHRIPVVSPNLINTSEEVAGGACRSCTVRKMGCFKTVARGAQLPWFMGGGRDSVDWGRDGLGVDGPVLRGAIVPTLQIGDQAE